MTDPITEINTATRIHFMPVVTNQLFTESPVLYRIFRAAKEGKFGLALPSFDGRSIAEPLEIGDVSEEIKTIEGTDCSCPFGDDYIVEISVGDPDLVTGITNRGIIEITDNDGSKKSYAISEYTNTKHLKISTPYEGTGATNKAWKITYYELTSKASGAYDKTDDWGAGEGDVLSAANFTWKMYHNTIKIHNLDVEINKGRERIFDVVALKMRSATKRLRRDLITDFYANQADGGKGMIGLRAIVAKTGLIGNIQKTKYDWWQGNRETGSSAALSWAMLNKMWYQTKKYGNADPATLIVMPEGCLQAYEDSISKTTVAGSSGTAYQNLFLTVQADKARKVYDGGFHGFAFKNIPMIADPFAPAGSAFFINEKYVHWRVLKAFESTGWQQLRAQSKDWAQLTIFGYGALTTSCNRKFGEIHSIQEL